MTPSPSGRVRFYALAPYHYRTFVDGRGRTILDVRSEEPATDLEPAEPDEDVTADRTVPVGRCY